MKTVSTRIVLSFCSVFAMIALCLLVFPGCDILKSNAIITILEPDNSTSYEEGDSITFEMGFTVYSSFNAVLISKGTIIEWASNIDGAFWEEEIAQDIKGNKVNLFSDYSASYSQLFSTSALSVGNHTISCRAYTTDGSENHTIAASNIRIYITESQTSTTTTTTSPAEQRFIDNGNGTVTDTKTGRVWLQNASIGGWKTWYEAETYCANLANGQDGLTDGSVAGQWRLPEKEELQGIGTEPPATWDTGNSPVTWTTPGEPFTPVQKRAYWSATISDSKPDYACTVNMKDGSVLDYSMSSSSPSVWPVRDGN